MRIRKIMKIISLVMVCTFVLSTITFADQMSDRIDDINKMINMRKISDFQGCLDLADELLKKDSSFMEAYYNKSMAYYKMNKMDEALAVLEKQLELNPNNELALYNAACTSSLLNQKDKAIGFLQTLKALDITIKSRIVDDKDFDNIKNTEEFKKILDIDVRVGGELLKFDVSPVTIENRTMLPIRTIFDSLGATIEWNNDTNTVTSFKGETTISLTINNKIAIVNSKKYEMEVAPTIYNDRTLVPVRFIADSLNSEVLWNEENNLVDITMKMPEGTSSDYDSVYKELIGSTAVVTIDGMWPEPYHLNQKEGIVFIVAKDKKALDLLNSLSEKDKMKYMYNAALSNYGLVIGCEPIHIKFAVDGKVYYTGDMYYDKKDTISELKYNGKGQLFNIVKQYKKEFNYKDYYRLPESERTTSKTDE